MLSFLAFVHEGLKYIGSPFADGKKLAQGCLDKLKELDDPEQFPPRLLMLLASPAYLDSIKAEQLLKGVTQVFERAGHPVFDEKGGRRDEKDSRRLELMGCSVAAVFFDKHVWPTGALLICLASRLLDARVEANPDLGQDHDKTIKTLLTKLDLLTDQGKPIHSFADRSIFALFPGFCGGKYLAPPLHESLRDQLGGRVSIFGGVATADDPQRIRSGILFANQKVYRNAVVAAGVMCGTPFGISLTRGLQESDEHRLNVAELDPEDPYVVLRFKEGSPPEVMEKLRAVTPVPLLASMSLDHDPVVDQPALQGETLRLTREAREGEHLQLMVPEPEKMQSDFQDGIKESRDKAYLLNPIGGLSFRCTGLLRHGKEIGLDLERELALIEHDLSLRKRPYEESFVSLQNSPYDKPFVGGFVDGEAGVDKDGKSILGNWGNATLVFGDELRFRTPVYRGFEKLADFAAIKGPETQEEWLNKLTNLIYDIGFPGAMLSFCVREQEGITIVARSASGSRYKRVLDRVGHYPLEGDDVLAKVARTRQWQLILNSRNETSGSMRAANDEGIVSQYIAPLEDDDGQVRAVLQIDLGDISYDNDLYESEKFVLEALCKIVTSGLHRSFEAEESRTIRRLDKAMSDCLKEKTIKEGLQKYIEHGLAAFGLKEGHIRIAQEKEHKLTLIASVGDYSPGWRQKHLKIDFAESSPTAQAFRNEKIVVVNNPANNKARQAMSGLRAREKGLTQKLSEVGSYTNVPFKSELGERGVVTLISSEPWFFTWSHDNALKAFGRRVGFLLETLRRKERESFLLGVSPQFSRIRNFDDVDAVLASETKRFADSAKAEIASLYLWDEDRERYILRAQHGWANPIWVNAAYYRSEDNWTGSAALAGTPRHIPDLFKYYKPSGDEPPPRYTVDAFGQQLTTDFTMEAICLLLRIADERLGVSGEESGFITTDTELLQQGADNFASLIGILAASAKRKWREHEHVRRQEVYDATLLADREEPFESQVTLQVLRSYRAVKATFYKVDSSAGSPKPEFKVGFRRGAGTEKIEKLTDAPVREEVEKVRSTVEANQRNEKAVLIDRVHVPDDERDKPERVALAGLVRRACIPLVSEKRLVGVLDLHWSFNHQQVSNPDYRHGDPYLRMTGEVIGSAYGRSQMKKYAEDTLRKGKERMELSSKAVLITNAFVAQHQHELGTIVHKMLSRLNSLREAVGSDDEETRARAVEAFAQYVTESSNTINRIFDIGSRVIEPANDRHSVKSLINSALQKKRYRCKIHKIRIAPFGIVPEHLSVVVDPALIDIVLVNLLDNAINAMRGMPRRVMKISAAPNADGETITITIKDSGPGIPPAEHAQNMRGFRWRNGHISRGIPISRMILSIYGGELEYDPNHRGQGTQANITFPINYSRE
jgi:signal transduction histidine kinase